MCEGDRFGQICSPGPGLSTLLGFMLLLASFRCLSLGFWPGSGLPQHCPPARARHLLVLCPECLLVLGAVPGAAFQELVFQAVSACGRPSLQSQGLAGWALQWDSEWWDLVLRAQREPPTEMAGVSMSLFPSVLTATGGQQDTGGALAALCGSVEPAFPRLKCLVQCTPPPFPRGLCRLSG